MFQELAYDKVSANGATSSVHEDFQKENFSALMPTESLRTQDLKNVFGLGSRASALKFKMDRVTKNKRCCQPKTI